MRRLRGDGFVRRSQAEMSVRQPPPQRPRSADDQARGPARCEDGARGSGINCSRCACMRVGEDHLRRWRRELDSCGPGRTKVMCFSSGTANSRCSTGWCWVSQASKQTRPYTFETIIRDYTDNTADEQVGLPLKIPSNAVVDLGDVNATTTAGKPMWAPATTSDQSWLPAVPNNDLWFSDNVAHVIAGLNASPDVRGNNWTVPTRMQLTALLSSGCAADPPTLSDMPGRARIQSRTPARFETTLSR